MHPWQPPLKPLGLLLHLLGHVGVCDRMRNTDPAFNFGEVRVTRCNTAASETVAIFEKFFVVFASPDNLNLVAEEGLEPPTRGL